MNYWLVKTEPDTYSWSDLLRDKRTVWDGVRNFQARKNLQAMQKGDQVLFYHTGEEKSIVGISQVVKAAYADPADPAWVAVDLAPVKALARPVSLAEVKKDRALATMALVRVARLSVQPVTEHEFSRIGERAQMK